MAGELLALAGAALLLSQFRKQGTARTDPGPFDNIRGDKSGADLMLERTMFPPNLQTEKARVAGLFAFRGPYDSLFYILCSKLYPDLPPAGVKAVAWHESKFDPNARNREQRPDIGDDSIGVMQVKIETARWVAPFRTLDDTGIERELLKPETNICVGTKYLAWQHKRYGGDMKKVFAAYNAGSARVSKSTGAFINQGYVDIVRGYYQSFLAHFPKVGSL